MEIGVAKALAILKPGQSGLSLPDTQGLALSNWSAPSALPSVALPPHSTVSASTMNLRQPLASSSQPLSTTEMANVITASSLPMQLPRRPGSEATVQFNPLDFMVSQKVKDQIWARKYVELSALLLEDDQEITAPNNYIFGAVYIKGGTKNNTFEHTTAIYTTLFSLAITLYQQPAFHFFPTLLLFLSFSSSYLSNPRSTHLYSDQYSIPG